ncbi:type VI secretion system-associated FHA domain protein TagH [Bowmanella denitrificans]|uniref:type VI secretion system-associated FHA domain protein TagH n=1 Tax=Bowmanella denitrificans TaxID=366582 RepID=UPI001559E999|nr:type VI secretion system-associated FHA domain protein TagH [Bowmanella denitrificans]
MSLKLEIISYQKESTAQPAAISLDSGGINIGRDRSNDWCLTDPDRILSKQHCRVEKSPDGYLLFDLSTNGVFLNQSLQAIGKGNSVKLKDGDHFKISDYEIRVGIEAGAQPDQSAFSMPDNHGATYQQNIQDVNEEADWHQLLQPQIQSMPDNEETAVEMPELAQSHYDAPSVGISIPEDWSMQDTPEPPQKVTTPPPPPPEQATSNAAAPTEDLIKAFLSGAGLPATEGLSTDPQQFMTELGSLFRCMTKGMIGVLAARGDIKGEFRLAQTMIKPTENNPLKFSLNVEEAMQSLISKRGSGYMAAEPAFDEAFEDLKTHQMAMLAGMQNALQSLLNTFNPQRIEQSDKQSSGVSKLLGSRKSAYWDNYVLLYKTLCRDGEDDVQNLFGRDFAKAYEQQIKKQRQ